MELSQFWKSWFGAEQALERLDGDGVVGHDRHERHGKDPRRRPPRPAGRLLVAFVGRGGGWEQAWESQRAVLSALAVPWRAMACFDPSHTDKHPPEMLHGLHVDEIVARVATASLGRDDDPSLADLCDPSLAAANGTADGLRRVWASCALRRLVACRTAVVDGCSRYGCTAALVLRPDLVFRDAAGAGAVLRLAHDARRPAVHARFRCVGGGAVPTRTRVADGLFSRLCQTEFSANGSTTVRCPAGHFTLDDHLAWVPAQFIGAYFGGAEFPVPPADAGVCPATRRWPEGRLTAAVRAGATVKELENVPTCLADSRHGMACEKGQVDFAPDAKASGDGVRYSGPPGPSAAPAFDCACGAPPTIVDHLNFQDFDLSTPTSRRSRRAPTPEACRAACDGDAKCVAFTFITGKVDFPQHCFLKAAGFEARAQFSSGTVSGVKAGCSAGCGRRRSRDR
jgi:hypothetical protein